VVGGGVDGERCGGHSGVNQPVIPDARRGSAEERSFFLRPRRPRCSRLLRHDRANPPRRTATRSRAR
jgi:hypothetical protein